VKDAALNAAYRSQYASCHRQYSLGAPFTERFFELALTGINAVQRVPVETLAQAAGFVGLITANSFMKREFGSKLIEQVLPRLDLTHVVDTSGAYIPGHGTPTVILFGRHRPPLSEAAPIRTVMGIKGEPSAPTDPAHGLVWSAILEQMDRAGSQSEFVSVADTPRATFAKHPWSIGGGGATTLADVIESAKHQRLKDVTEVYSGTGRTSADDVLAAPTAAFTRKSVDAVAVLPLVEGDQVRDWLIADRDAIITPYSEAGLTPIAELPGVNSWLWRARTVLGNRVTFGNSTYFAEGRAWWSWHQISVNRLRYRFAITFAEIATHNHFVLDRGGKAFKQTAPVIKLPADASEYEHLGLLGLLNSSVACFWLQQVCHNKGRPGADVAGADERYEMRYAINASNVAEYPIAENRPIDLATRIDTKARQLAASQPAALLAHVGDETLPTRGSLDIAHAHTVRLRRLMIAGQEELDWRCYGLYGLLPAANDAFDFESESPPEVALGERAFEIVLARRMAAGTETTTWFVRHSSTPITDIPGHWPENYRQVMQRRIDLIESDRNIRLIERPEYKRRWNSPKWDDLEQAALRDWLLARLELPRYWPASFDQPPQLSSTSRLADAARLDTDFMQIAALYAGHADFDPAHLVAQLVASEAVPFLPALRYTDTGLRKRAQWEDTWALQRREDAGEDVGKIAVPPKYKSTDFLKAEVWRLRGGLDVPKERWVSYPGCERGADGSLPIAWAGWDHLQQATALAAYYLDMKDNEGWPPERLQPLLAGLLELVPWLEQWHNEVDPVYGERMGHYYKGFVAEEARELGFTLDDLKAYKPATTAPTRGRRRVAA
ncbi:MAG: BREX-2 system adenine-specific DNA-methyltransferase PglX, partial [Rhodoferax sp.]